MSYLLRGVLIGIVFGVPGGAIGVLAVRRTFNYGRRAGLLTGLGSSLADSFHACVGVFGITLFSDFIAKYETIIGMTGGSLILFMGFRLLFGKQKIQPQKKRAAESAGMCLSSFLIGITNPAMVFLFLVAFSYFDVPVGATAVQRGLVVCGVFLGTCVWWGLIATVVPIVQRKAVRFKICYMNKISGALLCLLGVAVFLKAGGCLG